MADQTVSLELTGDADDLIAAVNESGQAMEELAGVGTQAASDIEQSMSGQESMWERNAGAIQATGAAAAAAGVALEGLARSQQDNRAVAGRLANALEGETTDSIMGLAAEVHNATTNLDSLIHGMEAGAQQGLESGEDLQEFALFWDMVADATGESHDALTDASVALRAVGVAAGDESEALGAFGFIAQETTGSVGEFLQFLERTGPELRDLGADVDDAAAIMGVLEQEFGMSGRTARTEFRAAINESDGTLQGLLDTLGVGPEVFANYRVAVGESTGVIEANAEAFAESRTFTQELWADVEALGARFSGLTEAASSVAPVLTGAGGAAWGFSQVRQVVSGLPAAIGGVRTALSNMSSFLLGPWGVAIAAATVGVGLFVKAKREAQQRVDELRATLDAQTGALTDNTEALAVNRLQEEGAIAAARELGISMETLVGAALGVPGAMDDVDQALNRALSASDSRFGAEAAIQTLTGSLPTLRDELGQASDAAREQAEATAELDGRYVDLAHALDSGLNPAEATHVIAMQEAADAAEESGDAVEDAGDQYEDTAEDTLTAAEAVDEYIAANRRATDPVFRLTDAIGKVDDAQQAYTDAVDEHGESSREASDAALDLMGSLGDLEAAAIDGDLSFQEFEAQLARWVSEGRITAEQAAAIRDRVGEARGQAEQFDDTYTATLLADDQASAVVETLIGRLGRVQGTYAARLTLQAQQYDGERARGGPVRRGGTYLVGEHGPELATFGESGFVHDAATSAEMMAGPGPTASTVRVVMPVMLDGRQIGRSEAVIDSLTGAVVRQAREMAGAGL